MLSTDAVKELFQQQFDKNFHIKLLSMNTADGFNIQELSRLSNHVETDRISAICSSLFSLSKAGSMQILRGNLKSTLVETDTGHLLLKHLLYDGKDCVLAIVTDKKMTLGESNFVLSECVRKISNPT